MTIPIAVIFYWAGCLLIAYKLDTCKMLNEESDDEAPPPKKKKNQIVNVREFIAQGLAENAYESVQFANLQRQTPYLVGIEGSMDDLQPGKFPNFEHRVGSGFSGQNSVRLGYTKSVFHIGNLGKIVVYGLTWKRFYSIWSQRLRLNSFYLSHHFSF